MTRSPALLCERDYCPLEASAKALLAELKGRYDFRMEGQTCGLCGRVKGWERKADGTVHQLAGNINV